MSHTGNRAARRAQQTGRRKQARTRGGPRTAATRPPGRTAYRRALRREAPVVVGLILGDDDFTAMTRYRSFPFDDYRRYLHHVDELLRGLHAQGTHVAVTLFDPAAYTDYCEGTRQPPDAATTRTRYVAEASTTGASVRYDRQSLPALRIDLAREADRRATWERATDLLVDAGPCPDCGQDLAHCAFDRASHTLLRLIEALGPGSHHLVCSLPTDNGPTLLAAVTIDAPSHGATKAASTSDPKSRQVADGERHFGEADALVVCTVIAAGAVTARPGGLVVRTTTGKGADRTETVRGWSLRGGDPYPLSEAEVFNAYCSDPETGEPVPPEPGLHYRAGLPLPPPPPEAPR